MTARRPILLVDTAGAELRVGLKTGERLLRLVRSKDVRHDRELGPAVERLLAKGGLDYRGLGAVAADRGPGRFTGVRIGLAYAVVLAGSLGVPALGISGLEALAEEAGAGLGRGERLLALLPATRDEVFWQLFERGPRGLRPAKGPGWCPLAGLAQAAGPSEGLRLAGPCAAAAAEFLPGSSAVLDRRYSLDALAALAASLKPARARLAPLYLKPAKYQLLGK